MSSVIRNNLVLASLAVAACLVIWLIPAARALVVQDINPIGIGNQPVSISIGLPAGTHLPRLETGIVSGVTNAAWTTVTLDYSYDSMVVIASINYGSGDPPMVSRIQNASASSFDVRIDRADGLTATITGIDVYYLAIEEGTYSVAEHGVKLEAIKYSSTVTDAKGSWTGETASYSNSYTTPVVLGQVMSYNDPDWSVFWAYGTSNQAPPSSSALNVGKHVAEDTDATRSDETVGYVVFEAGSGTIGDLFYEAGIGTDTVLGTGNSPPYDYSISGFASPISAQVSSAAMDGGDGGWPILWGVSPLGSSTLSLAIEEDTIGDADQSHTSEQVAYVVWE